MEFRLFLFYTNFEYTTIKYYNLVKKNTLKHLSNAISNNITKNNFHIMIGIHIVEMYCNEIILWFNIL